jgi:hypothetical protein
VTSGRWVLLFGLVGWAFGFVQMAWAGLDCGMPILGGGTCVGLSGADVLRYVLGGTVTVPLPGVAGGVIVGVDPRAALYAIPTALIGAALLLGVALWRRATSRTLPIWTALWLLAASGFAILAQSSVRAVVADAPALGLPAGAWQGAAGIYVTLVSLILVLAGLTMRWLSPLVARAHQLQPA